MNPDFLVVGGGVVGINIARELKRRFTDASVHLLEKEATSTAHGSGRNSGILHAGFYYTADSLKARFTRNGNALLTEYCTNKGIPLNRCGKLVVAQSESDLPLLNLLLERGRANSVQLHDISAQEAKEIEPRVKTLERALFSPTTSSVDPLEVVTEMVRDATREGVVFQYNTAYLSSRNGIVLTSKGSISPGYLVNAAGLYADKVAGDYGFSDDYRILPFKGIYLYSDECEHPIRTHIYPVPDLQNPFLGVHFTVTSRGQVKIGPTAIPAFWREQYQAFQNFRGGEFLEILARQAGLFIGSRFDFRKLAIQELRKYHRPTLVGLASALATGIEAGKFRRWGRPGIRAQLLNVRKKKLEMDFVVEGDQHSFHVLNAVSPGFTCCIPFADYIGQKISNLLK